MITYDWSNIIFVFILIIKYCSENYLIVLDYKSHKIINFIINLINKIHNLYNKTYHLYKRNITYLYIIVNNRFSWVYLVNTNFILHQLFNKKMWKNIFAKQYIYLMKRKLSLSLSLSYFFFLFFIMQNGT